MCSVGGVFNVMGEKQHNKEKNVMLHYYTELFSKPIKFHHIREKSATLPIHKVSIQTLYVYFY